MSANNRFAAAAFVGMICTLALAWPAAARTIYVDDDAPNDPGPADPTVSDPLENGSSAHPYDAIQQGINAAVAGDTVLVADGTYTGTGNKDLDFAGKAITVRSASGNPAACIIDCQGSGRGFYFRSAETQSATVAGLTIRNGFVGDSSPGGARGGGIYCYYSSPTLADCRLSGNTAFSASTGAHGHGGAVYCMGSASTLNRCTVSGSTAHTGGGVYCEASSASLTNCAIIENMAVFGAGVYCNSANPKLTNCTVSGNTAYSNGGALCSESSAGPIVTNCIFWGDTPQEIHASSSTPIVTYCDIQGAYAGTANTNVDPRFAFADDFHLMAASPCVEGGTNTPPAGLPPQDADGNPRSLDGNHDGEAVADIGAYEFNAAAPTVALSSAHIEFHRAEGQTGPESQTLLVRNGGAGTLRWTLGSQPAWLQADMAQGESMGEVNTVTLTADASTLSYGMYSTLMTVSDPQASNSPRTVEAVLYVNKTLHVPSEYPTIQAAIDATMLPGDQVVLADGVYAGGGNKDLDFRGKPITLRSASGDPAACIIDCDGSGRGLYLHSGEPPAAKVVALTIRHGSATDSSPGGPRGAAAFCYAYSNPTLINCTLIENAASSASSVASGGGIYCYYSSPTLADCSLIGNTASYGTVCCNQYCRPTLTNCTISGNTTFRGGGVHCNYSSPTLTNCTINDNAASYAGGVLFEYSNAVLTNCTISGNRASLSSSNGGGVYCDNSNLTLTACTITGNTLTATSLARGAGVYCDDSSLTLADCTISRNSASSSGSTTYGGAVYCSFSSPTLTGCTISGNSASSNGSTARGGGVYCYSCSNLTLSNCNIAGNTASSGNSAAYGGAVYCEYSSSATLTNCTISGNRASSSSQAYGGAVYCSSSNPNLTNCILRADTPQEISVDSSTPVVTYCDVQGGYGGTGNLNLDPLFVDADGPDGIYGTDDDDVHLLPTSPCIDAGDPASDFSLEPEPDGGRINMGAYGNTPEAETKGWIYIDGYNIVRKTRVGRTIFEYDLATTVRNASSQGVTNLVATLLAAPSNVQVIDAVVNVGSVPANSTVESADTFTIRVDRTTLVSPLPISWRVTYSNTFAEFTTLLDLGPPRLPGDLNCDGRVDFDDINPFVLALTGADGYYDEYPECAWLNADCNGDGLVDFDDINPFVELLTR